MNIKEETFTLIDGLKSTCQQYGLGNDGNEYKIITKGAPDVLLKKCNKNI